MICNKVQGLHFSYLRLLVRLCNNLSLSISKYLGRCGQPDIIAHFMKSWYIWLTPWAIFFGGWWGLI